MVAFAVEPSTWGRLDLRLLQNGPVHRYWRASTLAADVEWLSEHGYEIAALDAGGWEDDADLHRAMASALDFPGYYGRNLDALNDCLSDVAIGSYGWSPTATGLAITVDHFDGFLLRHPETAWILLNIIASQAWTASLFGHRLLCLVRTADPDLALDPVGATAVRWNPDEARSSRRPTN